MKLTRLLGAFLALGMLILAPVSASAQDTDPTRVQQAIDATDDRLEKARMVVENSDNRAAEAELSMAVSLQVRAKSAFAASQYRLALGLTLEARVHIEKALRLAQGPDPDREAVHELRQLLPAHQARGRRLVRRPRRGTGVHAQ